MHLLSSAFIKSAFAYEFAPMQPTRIHVRTHARTHTYQDALKVHTHKLEEEDFNIINGSGHKVASK